RLRRDPGDRAERHAPPDRLHLGVPLRVHHPGHLRDDHPGALRGGAVHGQPRLRHRCALPDRGLPHRPPGVPAGRRLPGRAEGRPGAGRHLPGGRPGRALAARPGPVRQRVPGVHRRLHVQPGAGDHRRGGRGAGRPLHPVDVPADHDRPAARAPRRPGRPGPARARRDRTAGRADHPVRRLPAAAARRGRAVGAADHGAAGRHRPRARGRRHRSDGGRPGRSLRVISATHAVPGAALAAPVITDSPPSIDYWLLAPMLVVFAAGVLAVLAEVFVPRPRRRPVQLLLALGGVFAAFVLTVAQVFSMPEGAAGTSLALGAVAVDRPALFPQGTILGLAFISLLLIAERHGGEDAFAAQAAAVPGSEEEREHVLAGSEHTEVYPLVLFAVLGMLLFPAANDFLTLFVALEVMSLPLYLLCGIARRRRLFSQEAAVKYFLLGAFSSAFFLFGIALVYGYAGSVNFARVNEA